MAAVRDNSVEAFSASAATTLETATFAVGGSNRVLYVFVATGAGTPVDPSAVKWGGSGGTSLAQISTTLNVSANGKFSVWRLIAPTAQTSTVHVTWGSSQDERLIIAVSVKDADQTTPNGTVATATGTSASPSVAAASVSGDYVLSGGFWLDDAGSSRTVAVDASETSIQEIEGADVVFEGMWASEETAAGTSTTMSATISGSEEWGMFAFAVNGAAAGGTILRQMMNYEGA